MTTREGENKLLRKSIPVEFWISGYNRNENSEEDVCSATDQGDLTTLCPTIATNEVRMRISTPLMAKTIELMLLSIRITFGSGETSAKFRLALSTSDSSPTTTELQRQTIILNPQNDYFVGSPGSTLTQYNIPLHLLIDKSSPQRYYYLTIKFDSTPVSGYDLTLFNIKGSIQIGEEFDYKIS